MALTQEEKQIVEFGKAKGKTLEQSLAALGRFRKENVTQEEEGSMIKDLGGDIGETFTNVGETLNRSGEDIVSSVQKSISDQRNPIAAGFDIAGQVGRGVSGAFGDVLLGVGKSFVSQETENAVKGKLQEAIVPIIQNPQVQSMLQQYQSLPENEKQNLRTAGNIGMTLLDILTLGGGSRVAGKIADEGGDILKNILKTGDSIPTKLPTIALPKQTGGIIQTGKELLERVPRALGKGKEYIEEASERAVRIKNASPVVQKAIKSNLDEKIINTIVQSDEPTKNAFKQVVDIAEDTGKTIGMKKQPTIIGGELAAKQYDLINKQKKSIGSQLGEVTKELSKTEKVNMQDSFGVLDDILSNQNIKPFYTKNGVKLDFTGSKYTPAERTKIQQLYNLATEGGDSLSPLQIREKDQLFSKLKRESNFEGIGDIVIDTPDGNKSLFNVFRDVYSSKLDTVSPEIKVLNNEYRKLSQVTDDIEDSIFRTPDFNVTKTVDPAEFAKVNLRRIFGEAQSSPVFEAVADQMDTLARALGYADATPKQVAEFAQYIRKLYPDIVPKTGFQGGIKAGIGDIIEKISEFGKPDLIDQQRVLKELLNSAK